MLRDNSHSLHVRVCERSGWPFEVASGQALLLISRVFKADLKKQQQPQVHFKWTAYTLLFQNR